MRSAFGPLGQSPGDGTADVRVVAGGQFCQRVDGMCRLHRPERSDRVPAQAFAAPPSRVGQRRHRRVAPETAEQFRRVDRTGRRESGHECRLRGARVGDEGLDRGCDVARVLAAELLDCVGDVLVRAGHFVSAFGKYLSTALTYSASAAGMMRGSTRKRSYNPITSALATLGSKTWLIFFTL